MVNRRIASFGLALQVAASLLHAGSADSKIRILVLNSSGGTVTESVRININGIGVSKTVNVQGIGYAELPPGDYKFEYSARSYASGFRCVSVRSAKMDVLLGLAIRPPEQLIGEGPILPWIVSGVVRPGTDRSTIVKLIALFSGLSVESAADPMGTFSMEVFPQGKYLLVVLTGGRVIYQKELAIDISVPKALDLGRLPND
jgi:hypothetical protein